MKNFKMKNLVLYSLFSVLMSSVCHAGAWEMSTEMKELSDKTTSYSEVTFKLGEQIVVYTPTKDPYGLVFDQKFTLNGKDYFVTGWAEGAATMQFKVFLPESHKNQPLCEETSFAEEAQVRLVKGKLQISTVDDKNGKARWVACGK